MTHSECDFLMDLDNIHICTCHECRPDMFPLSNEPIDERHVSLRFKNSRSVYRVYLDGKDVTRRVWELQSGDPGWAYVFYIDESGHLHRCSCGNGACEKRLTGNVTFTLR